MLRLAVYARYDGVIHLVTAADGAEEHYKFGVRCCTDSNPLALDGSAPCRRRPP